MPVLGAIRSFVATVSISRLRVGGLALTLSLLASLVTASSTVAWSNSGFSAGDEQLLLTLTNQDRASSGLSALTNDSYLHKEAEWRAKDMGDRDYFSHRIPPSNTMVFDDMQVDKYCFKVAGENIGLSTYSDSTATTRIEKAFMLSQGHRDNILGSWQRIGVGAYKAADGRKLYAVLFSVPCAAAKPKPVVTPKPKASPIPVVIPTAEPTAGPTAGPTAEPTAEPTNGPTDQPTTGPTDQPTAGPTDQPTAEPTAGPTDQPTAGPTDQPTAGPTAEPTTISPIATSDVGVGAPTASPAMGPAVPNGVDGSDAPVNLRVRERTATNGPLDSLFQLLFGGLSV
jgi:uncharacterized protein YkwD